MYFTRLSVASTDQVSPIHVFSRCFNSFPLSRPKSNIPKAWKGRGKSTSPAQLARHVLSVWLCNRYFITETFKVLIQLRKVDMQIRGSRTSKHVPSFEDLDDVHDQLRQNLR